ncbi:MAG: DUF922 domain-containing protein [Archangium sp.]
MRALLFLPLLVVMGCKTIPIAKPRSLVVLPPTVWPRDTQIKWYDIEGDSEADLRAEMDAKGPDTDGERHDAYTRWHVTWRFPFVRGEDGCATGPVTTDVRVVVTLPRWLGYADEQEPLMRRWRRYLEALKTHEGGHRDTGFRAASEISEKLAELPPQPNCDEAEEVANAAAMKILESYRKTDVDYDAETRHGATQGAVFP